jgi:putative FmdB family regulatory protein
MLYIDQNLIERESARFMPVYEYEHLDAEPCARGRTFETTQSIRDDSLTTCPACGRAVRRLISRPFICTPTSDTKLKEMGFTKLVKRDTGVYENVTATGQESRYMHADRPETIPDLKRKISD